MSDLAEGHKFHGHDTDSIDCPCGPDYFRPCDEDDGICTGCWKCENGLIAISYDEAHAEERDPIIIVHQDVDLRDPQPARLGEGAP